MAEEDAETGERLQPERPRLDIDIDAIQVLITKYFRVYEVEREIRGIPRGQIAAFYVQMDKDTFQAKFDALREEIRTLDPNLLVILQHRLGEDVLLVARKPPVVEKGPTINIVLLVLTIITTTLGGAIFAVPFVEDASGPTVGGIKLSFLDPNALLLGFFTFSLPLILILGVHELGHYYVARRHRVKTSLPYFIPVPPIVPIGTFGAFISMKEPIPDRKALFDIGASGPIFGFLIAIPVVILGMFLTAFYAVPVPPEPQVHGSLEGPQGAWGWGYGEDQPLPRAAAFDGFNATYEVVQQAPASGGTHVERITFQAHNGTNLTDGDWRLTVHPIGLPDTHEVEVSIRVLNASATDRAGDFRTEDGIQVATFTVQLAREPQTRAFAVAGNATQVHVEIQWKRPSSSYVQLGDSLLFFGLQWGIDHVIPVREDVFTHPTGIAGWVGLLVTGFNLLPAGQLDGGHIARAVLGDRQRWASYASIALMFLLSFQFRGWIVMAILIVFLGLQHPPPLNDKSPLDLKRRWLAFAVFVLLVATFVPVPFALP
jgi:membrane-associated protease RseP (regulator of RpoE activity)